MAITFVDYMNQIERLGKVSIREAYQQTKSLLSNQLGGDESDIDKTAIERANELLNIVLSLKQNGTANDYHNYAVSFAVVQDYDAACEILEKGLLRTPKNVDLLADFIAYAPHSSRVNWKEECDKKREELGNINMHLWTWRAYDFIIDYLLEQLDNSVDDLEDIKKVLDTLVKAYKERFPSDEKPFFSEYLIKLKFGENESAALFTLKEQVINNPNIHPFRVALRLAEFYYENNEFEEAINLLNLVNNRDLDDNSSSIIYNIYYLKFMAKALSVLKYINDNNINSGDKMSENIVKQVKSSYDDFRVLKQSGNSEKITKATTYRKLLSTLTRIAYEDIDSDED